MIDFHGHKGSFLVNQKFKPFSVKHILKRTNAEKYLPADLIQLFFCFVDVSCKNDSECDHSNCYYCTSTGYCRLAGWNYCDAYDCGVGDGSCKSFKAITNCKSNLTCGTDNFLDYHPLLANCSLKGPGDIKDYGSCVPKGI